MVEDDFEHILDHDSLKHSEYGGGIGDTIHNLYYDVFLHHEFARDERGRVTENWRAQIPNLEPKWRYLRDRWRGLISCQGLAFVRQYGDYILPDERPANTSKADYEALHTCLRDRFPKTRTTLLVADPPIHLIDSEFLLAGHVGGPDSSDWENPADYWRGSNAKWSAFFRSATDLGFLWLESSGIAE
jgi:hypothetical protein